MSERAEQEARRRVLREAAWAAAAEWELPDLGGESDAEIEMGLIVRAEALRAIARELVTDTDELGLRPAPWGTGPARQWWARVVLPAAREHRTASWWVRRSPREAMSWAIVLDPAGAARAGII